MRGRSGVWIGIDPGQRVGVAWVNGDGVLLRSSVVDRAGLLEVAFGDAPILLGDGTGSAALRSALRARGIDPIVVDERGTSEEGRRLYWRDHPASGWRRLVPLGLRVPPRDIDDYAAYAIVLRYLARRALR